MNDCNNITLSTNDCFLTIELGGNKVAFRLNSLKPYYSDGIIVGIKDGQDVMAINWELAGYGSYLEFESFINGLCCNCEKLLIDDSVPCAEGYPFIVANAATISLPLSFIAQSVSIALHGLKKDCYAIANITFSDATTGEAVITSFAPLLNIDFNNKSIQAVTLNFYKMPINGIETPIVKTVECVTGQINIIK